MSDSEEEYVDENYNNDNQNESDNDSEGEFKEVHLEDDEDFMYGGYNDIDRARLKITDQDLGLDKDEAEKRAISNLEKDGKDLVEIKDLLKEEEYQDVGESEEGNAEEENINDKESKDESNVEDEKGTSGKDD
ncbi:acidic leucine-rich nuclear phosphoprotein 32 family member A-like [Salvia splendens]|uniref:acidic leucine-rich nuclear phosphoprotein 32 family member A-like n=1 Tax=Salvia splendens TaxID=180675 RepID=UPI001C273D5F|nr:acidic leucine-rich nuclear phosphoprotein 32 family member A-like [Salvia splendens]